MWGTHGVTYNKELVLQTYPDAPIGDISMIFDPKHMKELAKCGVSFLDSPTDVIPMALAYMGMEPGPSCQVILRPRVVSDRCTWIAQGIRIKNRYAALFTFPDAKGDMDTGLFLSPSFSIGPYPIPGGGCGEDSE